MPDLDDLLVELTGADEARAEIAALSLAEHGESVLPALAPLLQSPHPDHRWWAVRTLAAMTRPPRGWLLTALRDESTDVRAAAALALVAHPDEAAAQSLIEILEDASGVAALTAAGALRAIGPSAVPLLLEAFERANASGRIPIMRALAESRDPRAIALMLQTIGGGSTALQYWAQEGLEALGLNMVYLKPE